MRLRKEIHWDEDKIIVEMFARSFEKQGREVLYSSSRKRQTLSVRVAGEIVRSRPDLVVEAKGQHLYIEIKSRLFRRKWGPFLQKQVEAHFAPPPRCHIAAQELREKPGCEAYRMGLVAKKKSGPNSLVVVMLPYYAPEKVKQWTKKCLLELKSKIGSNIELWTFYPKRNALITRKEIDVGFANPPRVNSSIFGQVILESMESRVTAR